MTLYRDEGVVLRTWKLGEADYRGARFAGHWRDLRGNNDVLVLTRPDVIAGIHDAYLVVGSAVATPTGG